MLRTGQKPGKGTYACMTCRHRVTIKDDETRLPFCSRCGYGTRVRWRKLG
ncbi:MAG: hypothetical protein IT204_14940 [Fimbriimonadaceae bacterium]|nr:hypothetical protein [Fimbriimonadaceae bacterium]